MTARTRRQADRSDRPKASIPPDKSRVTERTTNDGHDSRIHAASEPSEEVAGEPHPPAGERRDRTAPLRREESSSEGAAPSQPPPMKRLSLRILLIHTHPPRPDLATRNIEGEKLQDSITPDVSLIGRIGPVENLRWRQHRNRVRRLRTHPLPEPPSTREGETAVRRERQGRAGVAANPSRGAGCRDRHERDGRTSEPSDKGKRGTPDKAPGRHEDGPDARFSLPKPRRG